MTASRRSGVLGALGWVAAGSMLANAGAYAIHLAAGRWLTPADYGQFAVVLSAVLVVGVPALAVQAVLAREVVHGRDEADLRRLTARTVLAVTVLVAGAVPVMSALTSYRVGLVAAGLVVAPLLTAVGAGQGILQGRGHFRLLGWVLAAVGGLRCVPVIGALAAGAGPAGALAAGAAGAAASAILVWAAVLATGPAGSAPGTANTASETGTAVGLGMVLRASLVQLVLVIATSVDLLMAPMVLDRTDTGIYAVGAIATKAAFWLPQAVGVVFYPSLADPATSRRSFRRAVTVVAGIGAAVTLAAAAAGPAVPLVFGPEYRPLVGWLGLFAFTGAALSVLQVALLSAIARDRTVVAGVVWAAVGVEVLAILVIASEVPTLAVIAAVMASVTALTTTAYGLRMPDRTGRRDPMEPAAGSGGGRSAGNATTRAR